MTNNGRLQVPKRKSFVQLLLGKLLNAKTGIHGKKCVFRGVLLVAVAVVMCLSFADVPHLATFTQFLLPTEGEMRQQATTPGSKVEGSMPTVPMPKLHTTMSSNTSQLPELDSIRGTSITWSEIKSNFAFCYREAVKRNPKCREVHENPKAFWRSTHNAKDHVVDFQRMDLASKCCAFNHTELMSPSPASAMYPWEEDYLGQGQLTDTRDTAWAMHSKLTLLTIGPLRIGQRVRFLIKVYTGWGKPRHLSGDIVYVWLVNERLAASIAAEVKDEGEGQYLAEVTLPWAGTAVVKATIAYTRELFRSVLYVQRLFTTFHWFTGTFKRNSLTEATPCSSLPQLPAFSPPEICNLTDINGGIPWYCGKPVKQKLRCQDWYGTKKISEPSYMPLNEQDSKWMKLTETKRPFFIPTKLVLNISSNFKGQEVIETPKMPCAERNLSTTFDDVTSTGYFYKKQWYPFACRLPKVDKEFLLKCLRNTTVIIVGDSNSRVQIDVLKEMTDCVHKIPRAKVVWHAPLRCDIDSIGMSIQYFPPKNPFYGSVGELVTNSQLTSFITKLESIPTQGRYIVHLHQFLHLVNAHLSIADQRVRMLRSVVARLLARNRQVLIIIQSPHAAFDNKGKNKHKMNSFLFEMQRTILKGLGDRVMFVNTYDMTIARENHDGHPNFAKDFTKLYFGHVCYRQ